MGREGEIKVSGFRFIHAADLHLDSPFRGMSHVPELVRERLRESTFSALRELVRLAITEDVDFVVLSGDIYDAADRSLRAQLRLQRSLQELSQQGIGVFILHGNHDPDSGMQAQLKWPDSVVVFGSAQVEAYPAYRRRSDGLQEEQPVAIVSGISYANQALNENVALQYRRIPDSTLYHIGMLHGNVDGDMNHDNYAPCSKQDLIRSGMDYWALGHIHTRQIIHTAPYIVYPGNTQGRSVKECGTKGCYVVEVDEQKQTRVTFHPLDDVRWFVESFSIESIANEQDLKERLEEAVNSVREQADGRGAVVRFILTGRGPIHRLLEQSGLVQELLLELRELELQRQNSGLTADVVWAESIQIQSGHEFDLDTMMEQDTFLGELFRLAGQAQEDRDLFEEIIRNALGPLRSHARLSRMIDEMALSEGQEWFLRAREIAAALLHESGEPGGTAE